MDWRLKGIINLNRHAHLFFPCYRHYYFRSKNCHYPKSCPPVFHAPVAQYLPKLPAVWRRRPDRLFLCLLKDQGGGRPERIPRATASEAAKPRLFPPAPPFPALPPAMCRRFPNQIRQLIWPGLPPLRLGIAVLRLGEYEALLY